MAAQKACVGEGSGPPCIRQPDGGRSSGSRTTAGRTSRRKRSSTPSCWGFSMRPELADDFIEFGWINLHKLIEPIRRIYGKDLLTAEATGDAREVFREFKARGEPRRGVAWLRFLWRRALGRIRRRSKTLSFFNCLQPSFVFGSIPRTASSIICPGTWPAGPWRQPTSGRRDIRCGGGRSCPRTCGRSA
jgi:hypothetical protein